MTLGPDELEDLAEAVYRLADWGEEPAKPSVLAKRILGADAVIAVPNLIEHARLSKLTGRYVIAVRASLPKPYIQHRVGHELAHWILLREGISYENDAEEEDACDYIGAAIHLRRATFRSRVRSVGINPRQLALDFGATETSVALRIGETEGIPLAVVTPQLVRARGPENWVWPDQQTVRAWARRPAPGLRKVQLDGRGRIALVADAED